MIYNTGEMQFEEVNDMNIPVAIFIDKVEGKTLVEVWDDDLEKDIKINMKGKWVLYADNYRPRKQDVAGDAYEVYGDSKEELIELINTYIIPIYEAALYNLKHSGELYFWKKEDLS